MVRHLFQAEVGSVEVEDIQLELKQRLEHQVLPTQEVVVVGRLVIVWRVEMVVQVEMEVVVEASSRARPVESSYVELEVVIVSVAEH